MKNRKARKLRTTQNMNDIMNCENKTVKRDECGSCPSNNTDL